MLQFLSYFSGRVRFREVGIHAEAFQAIRRLGIAIAADHQDRQVRKVRVRSNLFDQLEAIHSRQVDVGDQRGDISDGKPLQRFFGW